MAKWEPTVKGTLTGFFDYVEQKATDQGTFRLPPQSPFTTTHLQHFFDNFILRQQRYEIAYYHRFNPEAASLVYYSRLQYPCHYVSSLGVKLQH